MRRSGGAHFFLYAPAHLFRPCSDFQRLFDLRRTGTSRRIHVVGVVMQMRTHPVISAKIMDAPAECASACCDAFFGDAFVVAHAQNPGIRRRIYLRRVSISLRMYRDISAILKQCAGASHWRIHRRIHRRISCGTFLSCACAPSSSTCFAHAHLPPSHAPAQVDQCHSTCAGASTSAGANVERNTRRPQATQDPFLHSSRKAEL